jgi:hypothetical protein
LRLTKLLMYPANHKWPQYFTTCCTMMLSLNISYSIRKWKETVFSFLPQLILIPEDCEVDKHEMPKCTMIYDSAVVTRGRPNRVQALITEHFLFTHFLCCHAQKLNQICSNCVPWNTKKWKCFSVHLSGFPVFFSTLSKWMAILDAVEGSCQDLLQHDETSTKGL